MYRLHLGIRMFDLFNNILILLLFLLNMDCELFKKKSSWDNNIKEFYAPHEDLCGTRSIVWIAEKEMLISSENCGKIIEWDFKTRKIIYRERIVIDSWGKTATHRIQADSILNNEYLVVTTEEKVIVKNFITKKNIKEYAEKILFTSSISANGLIAFYKENESKDGKTSNANKISQPKQPAGFEIRELLTWRNKCSKLVKKGINKIEISKSGKYLILYEYENKISLWDVEKCKEKFTVSLEDSKWVHGLNFDANEKYFMISFMYNSPRISKVLVFNIKTENLFREFKIGNGYCPALAISPDERFLATGCDNRIQLWDWKTLQKLFSLGVDQSGVFELIFTKDSKGLFIRTAVARFFYWDLTKEEFYKTE